MVWKKGIYSYPLWVLYAVATGLGLVCLADAICASVGAEIHIGTYVCAIYIVAAGAAVFLLHRFAPKYAYGDGENHAVRTVAEAAAAVTLLAIGLVLRVRAIGPEVGGTAYYDVAAVVPGQEIPQIAHGAVYIYLQALRGLFYFTGNKLTAAVWAQIVIQLAAILLLYLAVRRLAGNITALVMLSFHVFSVHLIGETGNLSPAMLYLFLWALMLLLISAGVSEIRHPIWYCVTGILVAAVCYLDAMGCLLLLIAAGVFLRRQAEDHGKGSRFLRLLLFAAGAAAGFCGICLADARLSGKRFSGVVGVWLRQYRPEDFQMPLSLGVSVMLTEYIVLFCVLALGVFAFWRSKKDDHMAPWLLLLGVLAAAGCFGVFTQEVPMGLYVYLILTVMAGVALETCVLRESGPGLIRAEAGEESVEALTESGESEETKTESVETKKESVEVKTEKEPAKAPEENRESVEVKAEKEPTKAPEENREPVEVKTEKEPSMAPAESKELTGNQVEMIENPLPLPKKHVKKKLDYHVNVSAGQDDFDLDVDETDDFDI